jgi:hypothetical protein
MIALIFALGGLTLWWEVLKGEGRKGYFGVGLVVLAMSGGLWILVLTIPFPRFTAAVDSFCGGLCR